MSSKNNTIGLAVPKLSEETVDYKTPHWDLNHISKSVWPPKELNVVWGSYLQIAISIIVSYFIYVNLHSFLFTPKATHCKWLHLYDYLYMIAFIWLLILQVNYTTCTSPIFRLLSMSTVVNHLQLYRWKSNTTAREREHRSGALFYKKREIRAEPLGLIFIFSWWFGPNPPRLNCNPPHGRHGNKEDIMKW